MASATEHDGAADQTDVKKKFREALDRKQGRHADSELAEGRAGGGKADAGHGPAQTQRTFRRKSG